MLTIRKGEFKDLEFLVRLEKESFPVSRQSNSRSLRNSLTSSNQLVLIAEDDLNPAGAAILQFYKKTLRIYSISVLEKYKGKSIGKELISHIINIARSMSKTQIVLEADSDNEVLINWYKKLGFVVQNEIKDYYGVGENAYKMKIVLENDDSLVKSKKNIVVVDSNVEWLNDIENIDVIYARDFIKNDDYKGSAGIRIFNLCKSYEYQSIGYYVSLLAVARSQRVIPSVTTIKDFTDNLILKSIGEEEHDLIQEVFSSVKESDIQLNVFFGQTQDIKYQKLAKALYLLFEAPFLEFHFEKKNTWIIKKIDYVSIQDLEISQTLRDQAKAYFNQKRFNISRFKDYVYDMAILVDNQEANPPSCKKALSKFKKAAEKVGFYVDFITREDYQRISEYDALFIRTTTDVNDYTYQFSRYAYAEGLVVIDDPWSILKCSNKLYLHEKMVSGGVLTPKSWVLSNNYSLEDQIGDLKYPLILKKPDSAFSLGVFKVINREELIKKLDELFQTSDLIVAQEFIKSDYDWRIGVLDNVPLFACKYYMAKDHWQIYNWGTDNQDELMGNDETIPISEVPEKVLKAAVKAASYMGDGLYGVDLKEVDGKVYLIEVNDNPNIDHDVEDKVLGEELYLKIMKSFYNRIENSRNIKRMISN